MCAPQQQQQQQRDGVMHIASDLFQNEHKIEEDIPLWSISVQFMFYARNSI